MSDERPTFGSLFAGIGGIDLGLERAGWRGRWQVEWDPFAQHVLAHHWPDVQRYGDITDVDWATVESVDLIAGGFPCQPISAAGKQLAQADDRWLWPEFERAVRVLRPRYVLVENVANLLAVNNGSAFGEVLGDLAALGYDCEWEVISAADVGAPHRRDRLWIVAYARCRGLESGVRSGQAPGATGAPQGEAPQRQWSRDAVGDGRADAGPLADTTVNGRGSRGTRGPSGDRPGEAEHAHRLLADALGQRGRGRNDQREHAADADAPSQGVGPGGNGDWWATEPDVGRVAHGVPARVDRLRTLGNAVVPQIVEYLGRRILEEAEAVA